ncbi:DUF47 family protein [Candidatus Bathyarchaeota archaeon]|nr:DUF47 family protein [Candidatus Bathyarchaeota archaeon]
MVFPIETEERVKRRALSMSQDHLRKIVEAARKTYQIVDAFHKGDLKSAESYYDSLMKLEEDVVVSRRNIFRELAEVGTILISREDFIRFLVLTSEISDFCEGAAFRLLEIMRRGWAVNKEIKSDLLKLSEGMLETIFKLREMTLTLTYDSVKAREKAKDVENAEKIVDNLYRTLGIKILSSKMGVSTILLLRDVCEFLEAIADKAEEASDAASILSLTM